MMPNKICFMSTTFYLALFYSLDLILSILEILLILSILSILSVFVILFILLIPLILLTLTTFIDFSHHYENKLSFNSAM